MESLLYRQIMQTYLLIFTALCALALLKPHVGLAETIKRTAIGESIAKKKSVEDELASVEQSILPHKPNYLMPFTYYSETETIGDITEEFERLDHNEMKFQMSLKVLVWRTIWDRKSKLYFAYTNQSYWQAYNSDISSPFRETNHEPELFLSIPIMFKIFDTTFHEANVGFAHQSNGRSLPRSRSWNRLYLSILFDTQNWAWQFKPWYRLREDDKDSPDDPSGDDNPDIERFLGHFELRAARQLNHSSIDFMVRHNLRSDKRGALQANWRFPLSDRLQGYVQVFNGYGESLIDYDRSITRVGFGIAISNWY